MSTFDKQLDGDVVSSLPGSLVRTLEKSVDAIRCEVSFGHRHRSRWSFFSTHGEHFLRQLAHLLGATTAMGSATADQEERQSGHQSGGGIDAPAERSKVGPRGGASPLAGCVPHFRRALVFDSTSVHPSLFACVERLSAPHENSYLENMLRTPITLQFRHWIHPMDSPGTCVLV